MNIISSRQNPFVQHCRGLARRRDALAGDILIDGLRLLSDALAAGVPVLGAAATAEVWRNPEGAALAGVLEAHGAQLYEATSAVIEAASPVRAPSGMVAVGRRQLDDPASVLAPRPALVTCAAHVQDPGNLGAIVRSAEAAGATGVMVAAGSADPLGWKALRGSMGSAFRLPIAAVPRAEDACAMAREQAIRVVATTPDGGSDLHDVDLTGPVMILVGGEGAGLPPAVRAFAEVTLSIPMRPPVESLNVAVATGIILFEAHRQRRGITRR